MSDPPRILVVDDDPGIRALLSDLLATRSSLVTTTNAIDAIPPIDWQPFDLLIIDLNMPDLSGEEAIRMIRARPAGADLPILVLSAVPGMRERLQGVDVQAIVAKPFDADALLNTIDELLRRPRAAQSIPAVS